MYSTKKDILEYKKIDYDDTLLSDSTPPASFEVDENISAMSDGDDNLVSCSLLY